MLTDQNRVYDGWISLEAGVDAGRAPTLLQPNYVVSAENMVFRGGHPSPRPGFRRLEQEGNFTNPLESYDVFSGKYLGQDTGHIHPDYFHGDFSYKYGIFQSVVAYSPHHGEDCLMAMIGGRLFKIVPGVNDVRITEITLPERNSYQFPIAYMVQADKWLIVQDGSSVPILYDGNKARRSVSTVDPDKTEVPTGTIMAYGMGRLVVIVNQRDVAFGDLYGSHDLPDPADSLILFTERNFLTGGFDAAIPFQQGVATGAAFFPQLDTSTGNGQLMVFSERGASAFFLSLPREQWQTSQFQILALSTTGLRGHRSISVVNEDLWFRAEDGYRTFRQARSEATGFSHIPESTNVRQFLDVDTPWLLKYGSSIYFDNRIIGTCSPSWNAGHPRIGGGYGRPTHEGLVVVDFDVISSFGQTYKPAWDGHWSKMKITQLVTGRFNGTTRAFAFGIEHDEVLDVWVNQIYELSLTDNDDWNGQIQWELISRAFDFTKLSQPGVPFTENEVYDADVWLRNIVE